MQPNLPAPEIIRRTTLQSRFPQRKLHRAFPVTVKSSANSEGRQKIPTLLVPGLSRNA